MADQAQGIPPSTPPSLVTAQAGQLTLQQQQQQYHVAPQVQAPTAQQQGQQVVYLNWFYF